MFGSSEMVSLSKGLPEHADWSSVSEASMSDAWVAFGLDSSVAASFSFL